ncbi:ABC transporter permease [Flavihumibacter profundi]|uniref:ABC transporter permease n=1 Tax=Flavihumibacter profundi TaxID=2716883 RepID=UPI001CC44940|nr:ABC transporter permease [Flavihumibacter profundi]MBZ5858296.1 ABC transporter permease [Flavihumibacter profundi]
MNKTFIIIRREFLSRVQKKSFLLSTILLPLFIFGFYALIIYFSVKGEENLKVAVADQTGLLEGKLESSETIRFSFIKEQDPAALQTLLNNNDYTGYIIIPAGFSGKPGDSLLYTSNSNVGLMTKEKIQSTLNKALEKIQVQKLLAPGITLGQLDSTRSDITLKVSKAGQKSGSTGFAYALGFICGILIYAILFIYGAMVMRGVMEEKTSRIAEVMVSSVRPYQLMLGKIIGIGAVGLVQFLIWGVLIIGLQMLLPVIYPQLLDHAVNNAGNISAANNNSQQMEMVKEILKNMHDINIGKILALFILYFLGGYLLYSAMFAAVGSAVNEDPQDAQSLMLPITMPIIFSFVIMTQAINNPDGGLAIFGSLFPLSSPIVMMARLPYGVPAWQIALSLLLLVLGIMGTTWLASRIYRTGILMYGKKANWKELWKWAMRG